MDEYGSVTAWLNRLRAGDRDEAVAALWGRYFGKLVGIARDHLRARPRPAADEEDVALAAFDSFVRAAQAGRFHRLDDRSNLWQVLLMLTRRKAFDVIAADAAQKRGGGRLVQLSAVEGAAGPEPVSAEPDPAEAAALAAGLTELLGLLRDPTLQRVAVWAMEGYSNAEIGAKLGGLTETTGERKLRTIRRILTAAGVWPADGE